MYLILICISIHHLIFARINYPSKRFWTQREVTYPPKEVLFVLKLIICKLWIKSIDDFFNKEISNPKDSFSYHLSGYTRNSIFKHCCMKTHTELLTIFADGIPVFRL